MSIDNEKVKDHPVIIADDISDLEKSTNTTGTNNASPDVHYITPPDGGRGWLVVFASFMVNKNKKKK